MMESKQQMSVGSRVAWHRASSSSIFVNTLAAGPWGILVNRVLSLWMISPFVSFTYMKTILIIFAMIFHIIWLLEKTAVLCLSDI